MDTLQEMNSSNMKKTKPWLSQFEMCVMYLKHFQPDWTSRCRPLRDRAADGEQNQIEGGEKKMQCWFLKFISICGYQRQCPRT